MPYDYKGLEAIYIQRLQKLLSEKSKKKQSIVWQEIFDNGGTLTPDTIIDVWKGWGRGWQYELDLVTSEGYNAILSAPWYLNCMKYGSDWVKLGWVPSQVRFGSDWVKLDWAPSQARASA